MDFNPHLDLLHFTGNFTWYVLCIKLLNVAISHGGNAIHQERTSVVKREIFKRESVSWLYKRLFSESGPVAFKRTRKVRNINLLLEQWFQVNGESTAKYSWSRADPGESANPRPCCPRARRHASALLGCQTGFSLLGRFCFVLFLYFLTTFGYLTGGSLDNTSIHEKNIFRSFCCCLCFV